MKKSVELEITMKKAGLKKVSNENVEDVIPSMNCVVMNDYENVIISVSF